MGRRHGPVSTSDPVPFLSFQSVSFEAVGRDPCRPDRASFPPHMRRPGRWCRAIVPFVESSPFELRKRVVMKGEEIDGGDRPEVLGSTSTWTGGRPWPRTVPTVHHPQAGRGEDRKEGAFLENQVRTWPTDCFCQTDGGARRQWTKRACEESCMEWKDRCVEDTVQGSRTEPKGTVEPKGSESRSRKKAKRGDEVERTCSMEQELDSTDRKTEDDGLSFGEEREIASIGTQSNSEDDCSDGENEKAFSSREEEVLYLMQSCRRVHEFERLNKISEGSYGVVYRARHKSTGEIVALKKIKLEKGHEGMPITSIREIGILLSCKHRSIVRVEDVVLGSSPESVYMVMEYMEHDLKTFMETMRRRFNIAEVKCIMKQLLEGVAYLHDNWIIHRDLKTANLLLNNKGEVKLCDFGLAREYGSPLRPYTHLVVTLWYRAPELLLGCKTYSTGIDLWALGCIMAELLQFSPLFPGRCELDQLSKIFAVLGTPTEETWAGFSDLPNVRRIHLHPQPENRLRSLFPSPQAPTPGAGGLSAQGYDLLRGLLELDPTRRIPAAVACQHPWFSELPRPQEEALMPTLPSTHEGRILPVSLEDPARLEGRWDVSTPN